MNKRTIILVLLGLFCLSIPIIGGQIDLGSGTDDQAGETVQSLAPQFDPKAYFEAYEPSEAMEPWLFALQVALGIGLFAWAYRSIDKHRDQQD